MVPANSSVGLNFDLYVDQFAEAEPCLDIDPDNWPDEWPDECALLATAEVLIGDDVSTQVVLTQVTMSTPLIPYPSCEFDYHLVDGNFVSNQVRVSDICICTLPTVGDGTVVWGLSLYPVRTEKP